MSKNMKRLSLLLSAILVFSTFGFSSGTLVDTANQSIAPFEENVLIVQFTKNLPEQAKASIRANNDLIFDKSLGSNGLERVLVRGNRPLHSVINQLSALPGVAFVEPDYTLYATPLNMKIMPESYVDPSNDTYYNLLWGLNNTGQAIRDIVGDGSTDVDAPEAWEMSAGSNTVIVAVIDEAVDATHPDLQGVVIDYKKFNLGPAAYEHGTHVAGTIAANDNALGVVGVAPSVKIMSLSFLGKNGGSTSNAILAINYARENGAHIINASWGGGAYSQALKDAIESFGGPFVAAAGNSGVNTDSAPHYPSSYSNSNIVSVAAVANTGQMPSFSNYGITSVDVGAPGVDIVSTYPGGYAYMSGTSMATPHVAGVLALMKSVKPEATTSALIQALYTSGRTLASLSGKTSTGKLVDADAALNALGFNNIDTTPPELTGTQPTDGGSNVAISSPVKLTFNEPVKLVGTDIKVNGTIVSAQASGNEISITAPDSPLKYSTIYTIEVAGNTVADLSDNLYGSPIVFSFTTESEPVQQAITVVSSSPSNNQVNVKRNTNIVFNLSAVYTAMDTSKMSIKDSAGNSVSFTASGQGTSKLTLDPVPTLDGLTNYVVTLSEGAVSSSTASLVPATLNFKTGKK